MNIFKSNNPNKSNEPIIAIDRAAHLSTEEIKQCFNFAWDTWIYHNPNNRKPIQVWYDILQGKLAEFAVYKYCNIHNLKTNRLPNFKNFQNLDKGEVVVAITDLEIEGRKKEVKSTRENHKFVNLPISYFNSGGQYKWGSPNDLIFVNTEIPSLPSVSSSFSRTVKGLNPELAEEGLELKPKFNFQSLLAKYKVNQDFILERYRAICKGSVAPFKDDPLVQALLIDIDFAREIGEKITNLDGNYYLIGEISTDNFYRYARRVPIGHIFNLPFGFEFDDYLKEFLLIKGVQIKKSGFDCYEFVIEFCNFVSDKETSYGKIMKYYRDKMLVNKVPSFVVSRYELHQIVSLRAKQVAIKLTNRSAITA